MDKNFVKSPLNYVGGKYRLLSQLMPIFPKNTNKFVDLFAGGLNVCANIRANYIYMLMMWIVRLLPCIKH